jgi:hypothetical protein
MPDQLPNRIMTREMFTRRQFLAHSARIAAVAGFAPWLHACGSSPDQLLSSRRTPSQQEWDALKRGFTGQIIFPGDPGFPAASVPNNLRYASLLPIAIAECAGPQDVQKAILWAQEHQVPIAARAGGHSYGGFSTTEGLLISVRPMRSVSVDPNLGQVVVQAGATNGIVSDAMAPFNVAISQGRCPTVGIAGLTLGGGFGFSSRSFGLTCDHLIETTIVCADGSIKVCNENSEPDLFWACRGGGGGNFGINTSFTYAVRAVSNVSVYQIHWKGVSACQAMLAAFQTIMPSAPNEFSVRIGIAVDAAGAEPLATVNGQFFGSAAELREILAPVLSAAAPADQDIKEMTYWQGKDFLADLEGPSYYAERSRFVSEPLSSQAIAVIFDRLAKWPGGGSATAKLFSWGGAISQVPRNSTAFVHRNALFLASFSVGWPKQIPSNASQTELDWLNTAFDAFLPFTIAESYQNFIDPALSDWQSAYYGENLERLMSIKAVYDPKDVFQFAQSIPLPEVQQRTPVARIGRRYETSAAGDRRKVGVICSPA